MNIIKQIKYNRMLQNIINYLSTLHIDKYATYDAYYNYDDVNIIIVYHNHKLISIGSEFLPDGIDVDLLTTIAPKLLKCDKYNSQFLDL